MPGVIRRTDPPSPCVVPPGYEPREVNLPPPRQNPLGWCIGRPPDPWDRFTLGAGHHGSVRLAYSPSHDREVAIKCQRPGRLARREEALHVRLALPHVVRVLDVWAGPTRQYLVLERGYPVSLEGMHLARAQDWAAQMIRAVEALQAVGIYHRDVKLQNFRCVPEVVNGASVQRLKLIDMGKVSVTPNALMRPFFERAMARRVGRCCAQMLDACEPAQARAFRSWYQGLPHLRLQDLKTHPLLRAHFLSAPPCRQGHPVFRALWPWHRMVEKATAILPV